MIVVATFVTCPFQIYLYTYRIRKLVIHTFLKTIKLKYLVINLYTTYYMHIHLIIY